MLNTVLLVLIFLLEGIEATVIAVAGKRLTERRTADEPDTGEAPQRESQLDKGFENLMRFQVGGKDGFGGTEDE